MNKRLVFFTIGLALVFALIIILFGFPADASTALDSPLLKVPTRTPTLPPSPLLPPATPDVWITAGDSPLPTPTDDGIIFYTHDAEPVPPPGPVLLPESGGVK